LGHAGPSSVSQAVRRIENERGNLSSVVEKLEQKAIRLNG
jgi:hypothetical protein